MPIAPNGTSKTTPCVYYSIVFTPTQYICIMSFLLIPHSRCLLEADLLPAGPATSAGYQSRSPSLSSSLYRWIITFFAGQAFASQPNSTLALVHPRILSNYSFPVSCGGVGDICFSCPSFFLVTVLENYHSQYSNPTKNEKAELVFLNIF